MRVSHRRGVAEGVVVGAAIASSRRPPAAVVVPGAYPVGYGVPMPMPQPMYYPPPPRPATTEVIITNNSQPGQYPPQDNVYYPPAQPQPQYQQQPMPPPPAVYHEPPPYTHPPSAPAAAAVAATAAVVAGAEVAAVAKAIERRPFVIVNEANGSVLEVQKACVKPNTYVVADKRRMERPAHQVWYADEMGVIRCKLNDFALNAKENGERVRMTPFIGDVRQKWILLGNRITNEVYRNECIGLKRGLVRLKEDADVIACIYEGKPYQHWRIEYI